jgi:hypothetical protein
MARPEAHADRECTTDDQEDERRRHRQDQRMTQVELSDTSALAANENDIHVKEAIIGGGVASGPASNG